jgi:hypothetical protein
MSRFNGIGRKPSGIASSKRSPGNLRRSASNFMPGILCPYALTPEIQRDVEVVELKEKANQPGLLVWFVGATAIVDDWANTIARRGQGGQM